jgi:hypothetical protein
MYLVDAERPLLRIGQNGQIDSSGTSCVRAGCLCVCVCVCINRLYMYVCIWHHKARFGMTAFGTYVCMLVCVCVCVLRRMMSMNTHTHTYIHTCKCRGTTGACIDTCVYMHACMHVCRLGGTIVVCICISNAHVCMYARIYVPLVRTCIHNAQIVYMHAAYTNT